MNKIQIYGPGCPKCTSLAEATQQAVKELKWSVPVEKVIDPMLFAVAGVIITPALVMNGKVLIYGNVPSVEEIKNKLRAEEQPSNNACCSESSGCCGKGNRNSSGWKKAVIWITALLITLALVKMINRHIKETAPTESVPGVEAFPLNKN